MSADRFTTRPLALDVRGLEEAACYVAVFGRDFTVHRVIAHPDFRDVAASVLALENGSPSKARALRSWVATDEQAAKVLSRLFVALTREGLLATAFLPSSAVGPLGASRATERSWWFTTRGVDVVTAQAEIDALAAWPPWVCAELKRKQREHT